MKRLIPLFGLIILLASCNKPETTARAPDNKKEYAATSTGKSAVEEQKSVEKIHKGKAPGQERPLAAADRSQKRMKDQASEQKKPDVRARSVSDRVSGRPDIYRGEAGGGRTAKSRPLDLSPTVHKSDAATGRQLSSAKTMEAPVLPLPKAGETGSAPHQTGSLPEKPAPQAKLQEETALAATTTSPAANGEVRLSAHDPPAKSVKQRFSEADSMLFGMELDQKPLSEAFSAYGTPEDPFLSVGELARLLDLDLTISPLDQRVSGTIGKNRKPVLLDVARGIATIGDEEIPIATEDIGFTDIDVYARTSVLERLLPIRFAVDPEALSVKLTALEKLPLQERLEREVRMDSLGRVVEADEQSLYIASPYRFATMPSFDVSVASEADTRKSHLTRNYEFRVAGDLFHMGYQGFITSNDEGEPMAARLAFERRSPAGTLLGPLKATRISVGDIFAPGLAIGPRSFGGRGVSISTAPLDQISVFNKIDIRGEMPVGYDVELYINDVLRGAQRAAVQGRYEFIDVSLTRGINIIRIVKYGPRGEREETVRVLNVGSGQLAKRQLIAEIGLIEEAKSLLNLEKQQVRPEFSGALRLIGSLQYGLTDTITLAGGFGLYTGMTGDNRQLFTGGIRTSILGLATQADVAYDGSSGVGWKLGIAGQPFGVSTVLRHAEYQGGFIDEYHLSGGLTDPLIRTTTATADIGFYKAGGMPMPVAIQLNREEFAGGATSWVANIRSSLMVSSMLFSTGVGYQREIRPGVDTAKRMIGNFDASNLSTSKWQLRANLDYEILPTLRLVSTNLTADWRASERSSIRFGLGQTINRPRNTTFQTSLVFRLPFGDLSLTADHATHNDEWRAGVRFSFGSFYDSSRNQYIMTRPGPASGASAIFHSFIDKDYDGRYGPQEEAVPGVRVSGGEQEIATGLDGTARITGLGNGHLSLLQANADNIDNPFVAAPPGKVEFRPRAGQVLHIPYPLTPIGEVYVKLMLQNGEREVGLSAVRVGLVKDGAAPITAITEFDGSAIFSSVPHGTYTLRLDPEQAGRLQMRLKSNPEIKVTSEFTKEIAAEVVFEPATAFRSASNEINGKATIGLNYHITELLIGAESDNRVVGN